jgi:hypothetical protein
MMIPDAVAQLHPNLHDHPYQLSIAVVNDGGFVL